MRQIRRAADRGHADHGWLQATHTFSFADYYDPRAMGFRSLRVMNEDRIHPAGGFGMHPHKDMEIITYVLEGALQHKDSLGNGAVLRQGELQHITAGTGLLHSEVNPSKSEAVHLYQIWLIPAEKGLTPSYEQRKFDGADRRNRFQVVASPDDEDGALPIRQDARIYLADLEEGKSVSHTIGTGRYVWLQVLRGAVKAGEEILQAGDGLQVSEEEALEVTGQTASELMVFDLA
jgi:redox-sensitive bicupin YhaK (pirin superfamily)